MRLLLSAAAAASVLAGTAMAQTASDTTRSYTAYCADFVRKNNGPETGATYGCPCSTGVIGTVMTQEEYVLLGYLAPGFSNPSSMRSVIDGLKANGTTDMQIATVANKLQTATPYINRICSYFDRAGVAPSGNEVSFTVSADAGTGDHAFDDLIPGPAAMGAALLNMSLPGVSKE